MKSSWAPMRRLLTRFLAVGVLTALTPITSAVSAHAASSTISTVGFAFYNEATGRCADLPNYGSNPINTPVTQYSVIPGNCTVGSGDNQTWDLRHTRDVNDLPLWEFVNLASDLCMDVPNFGDNPAGTRVSIFKCAQDHPELDNQEFYLTRVTQFGYLIVNWKSHLCLDVSGWASDGSDRANNLPLTLYNCAVPPSDPHYYGGSVPGYDDHLWQLSGG
ncbi:RICIN domain-containing protein [Nonomuraea sp. NPDC050536]|uniref:RICIN domain-containing protein n=1 Tax=Nonomuraea sp. NPDC050536 TaxID=3364366 RepID=UPI0037C7ABAD